MGFIVRGSDPAEPKLYYYRTFQKSLFLCLFLWAVQFPVIRFFQFLILRERKKWRLYEPELLEARRSRSKGSSFPGVHSHILLLSLPEPSTAPRFPEAELLWFSLSSEKMFSPCNWVALQYLKFLLQTVKPYVCFQPYLSHNMSEINGSSNSWDFLEFCIMDRVVSRWSSSCSHLVFSFHLSVIIHSMADWYKAWNEYAWDKKGGMTDHGDWMRGW